MYIISIKLELNLELYLINLININWNQIIETFRLFQTGSVVVNVGPFLQNASISA